MAEEFLSVVDMFAVGIDYFEKVCNSVHISIAVLVGFVQGEKPLAKLFNQVIGRVCGFCDCGNSCKGEVLSMDVKDMFQELVVAFEFFFCLMCLNNPQVLLVDIFCLGGSVGLNGNIGHGLMCLRSRRSGKQDI
jgi:hypothetical protein